MVFVRGNEKKSWHERYRAVAGQVRGTRAGSWGGHQPVDHRRARPGTHERDASRPETNGVLDACREMDVALVAYRPMAGGSIRADSRTSKGPAALAGALKDVAAAEGATTLQVALAWLLKRDGHVIAISVATSPDHVRQNSRALTLELSDEEFAAIDRASTPI